MADLGVFLGNGGCPVELGDRGDIVFITLFFDLTVTVPLILFVAILNAAPGA